MKYIEQPVQFVNADTSETDFRGNLWLAPLPDGRRWQMLRAIQYVPPYEMMLEYGINGSIRVPKGFVTNFASSPSITWWVVPPWGTYGPATIVHDWMYWDQRYSRKAADEVFLVAMKQLGTPWWKRWPMYLAVRAWGWRVWRRLRREKAKGRKKVLPL